MGITRTFLDWSRPALPAVAEYLLERYAERGVADLERAVVVLPGGRAGRRLLELLVEACERQALALVPPQITTVGRLPELLYRPKRPFAGELVQQLAWTHALRTFDRKRLEHVVARPPEDADDERWMELGELLSTLHKELASDALDFADVAGHAAELEGDSEGRRWQVLAEIQQAYLHTLDRLELWDRQTARRVAIEHRECSTERHVILVATVDVNLTIRRMLDLVAEQVTALVVAPEPLAERFDEHGCLRAQSWEEIEIPLADEQVSLAAGVTEQADAAVRRLAGLGGKYRADEISMGVADERMVPHLLRQLEECELPARWGPGQAVSHSPPHRLLSAVVRYLSHGRRYRDFAALARHADVCDWLARQGIGPGWLAELDEYYGEYLPAQLGPPWRGTREKYGRLYAAHEAVEKLLEPLSGEPRRLGGWSEPLTKLLLEVYGGRELDREAPAERTVLESCKAIHKALAEQAGVPESLAPTVPAAEALRLALAQAASATVAAPADDAAIELLGWLELPLDDAPVLVVTGFNEGFVPKAVTGDLFLPNTLRVRLGLDDNTRRFARDAYALSVLSSSRQVLHLVAGRSDVEGNPLAPSRLLFATDAETVARRALQYFAEPKPQERRLPLAGGLVTRLSVPDFPVPMPRPLEKPIERISPSAVRTYLACRYRYYLQYVLRLEAIDDSAAELDGGAFGSLIHNVLLDFGRGEFRDSSDAEEIRRVLREALDRRVERQFGDHALTPVEIQVEQIKARLDRFAEVQADRTAEGWIIEHTETNAETEIEVDGQCITLSGRIDRIDRHRETGQRMVIDYKSGDSAKSPEEAHRKRSGEWTDLQLPLYRHLVRGLKITDPVRLAYIILPKDVSQVGVQVAPWSEAELLTADRMFHEVVRWIRAEVFWPPADEPPWREDVYSAICQDGVFDKSPHREEDEEVAAL